jgi:hypothetical protein|tara:strand:+ start:370 stop:648 length:279 start_codon:yes stop_codon:yes gene_type:complete
MPNWSKPDTLLRATAKRVGLIDLLGEDLYSILESGRVEADMPFGLKSKFDLRRQDINLQKQFGKDLMFDLDINKRTPVGYRDMIRLGVTKKF